MARFFDFYDPLDKRYVFNSFLVVVGLVEVFILAFTLIWQIDEGIFGEQVRVVPFPWKEYLLAAFSAPIALMFLFGLIVQGFEMVCREGPPAATGRPGREGPGKFRRSRYLLGLLSFLAALSLLLWGGPFFSLITDWIKALGLGGAYLTVALLGVALLYLPLRLLLRYRLRKKAMEYQYLLSLAERQGLLVVDPRRHPELAAALSREKNASSPGMTAPDLPEDPTETGSH